MSEDAIRIFEVGPRDGLQNESAIVEVDQKVELIHRLVASGVKDVEFGSFVHPKWVPQMADTDEVARRIDRQRGVRYWGLVPNQVGLERALEVGTTHVATFMSASETHNEKNVNRTIAESLDCLRESFKMAKAEDCTIRAYVSTAFGCPYEGEVDFERVVDIAGQLLEAGADMIALGDTIGAGTPLQVRENCERALEAFGADRLAVHLHDTQGMGMANALAAWQAGVRNFDSSVGATGGCPYAPGAAGNIGTEELVHMFEGMNVETGVDLDAVLDCARWLEGSTEIDLQSKLVDYCRPPEDDESRQASCA